MYTYKNYVRPKTLEEAYGLCQKKKNVVIGGNLWLKMSSGNYDTAIDLCDLGLSGITETEEAFVIGAMTGLRSLEKHEALKAYTQGAMAAALEHIVGVQFRNCATLGGSLWGRFGFSDVMTLFLALEAEVELYHAGRMPLAEFAALPRSFRDILVRVYLPKKARRTVYLSSRNSSTDFPTLTCALSVRDGETTCVIGARPKLARVIRDDEGLLADGITETAAEAFAKTAADGLDFEDNVRGSAAYRRRICSVLIRRGLMQLNQMAKAAPDGAVAAGTDAAPVR